MLRSFLFLILLPLVVAAEGRVSSRTSISEEGFAAPENLPNQCTTADSLTRTKLSIVPQFFGFPICALWSSTPACEKITVRCYEDPSDIPGGGGTASVEYGENGRCSLHLSQTMCVQFALKDGQNLTAQAAKDLASTIGSLDIKFDDKTTIDACAVVHEVSHLVMDAKCKARKHCEVELGGYWNECACLNGYKQRYCTGEEEASDYCKKLDLRITNCQAKYSFMDCLCDAGTTCKTCVDKCIEQRKPETGTLCERLGNVYCKCNGK